MNEEQLTKALLVLVDNALGTQDVDKLLELKGLLEGNLAPAGKEDQKQ